MDLTELSNQSKKSGKIIVAMVKGDLVTFCRCSPEDIDTKDLGGLIMNGLHTGIKEKELGLK